MLVPVTVSDPNGTPVSDLMRSQFRVFDNDEPRAIISFGRDKTPLSVVFVVDTSASMRGKMDLVRGALQTIGASAGGQDEAALVTFSDLPRLERSFTQQIDALTTTLDFRQPAGETALIDAIWLGLEVVTGSRNARRALVIISDGGDNHSRHFTSELLALAEETNAQVYGVAIHEQSMNVAERYGSALLKRLSKITGGLQFEVRSAAQLPVAAEKIGEATRNLYILGFKAPEVSDAPWQHRIRVNIEGCPKLRITSKASYVWRSRSQ